MMEREENVVKTEEQAPAQDGEGKLKKFKSVDALVKAYEQLEAEFTRRSQRLKALEEERAEAKRAQEEGRAQAAQPSAEEEKPEKAPVSSEAMGAEELFRAVEQREDVRARVVSEYLASLKGVPLLAGGGVGVTAPKTRAKSIAEAGDLALGFFRSQKK